VLVAAQLFVPTLYLPPLLNPAFSVAPPHTIISLPVQIAVWRNRPSGALIRLVATQLSVSGLYLPPVLKQEMSSQPPQIIISVPVQTAV
jgi:hypothetical protein